MTGVLKILSDTSIRPTLASLKLCFQTAFNIRTITPLEAVSRTYGILLF